MHFARGQIQTARGCCPSSRTFSLSRGQPLSQCVELIGTCKWAICGCRWVRWTVYSREKSLAHDPRDHVMYGGRGDLVCIARELWVVFLLRFSCLDSWVKEDSENWLRPEKESKSESRRWNGFRIAPKTGHLAWRPSRLRNCTAMSHPWDSGRVKPTRVGQGAVAGHLNDTNGRKTSYQRQGWRFWPKGLDQCRLKHQARYYMYELWYPLGSSHWLINISRILLTFNSTY